jgi:SAM-dependent methyltransferase
MSGPPSDLDRLGALYAEHHRERRDNGEFVFVPERIPFFVAAIGSPGRRVLDIGCRSGALTQHFVPGNDVVGLDVDPVALERAAARGITPVRANVEEPLPFETASFDAVVLGEILEHVRHPAELVAEARRVLRPGGVLVGSVPNAFRLQNRLLFLAGREPEDDPTHLHMYSPAAVRRLLAGFEGVRLAFVGGRYRRLQPRLLSRDLVFSARRPP